MKPSHHRIIPNWLLLICAIVIVGALGYLVWFYCVKPESTEIAATPVATTNANTNTNSATADWKTYTNTDYGFSIEYPTEWSAKEIDTSKLGNTLKASIDFIGLNKYWLSVTDLDNFATSIQNGTFTDKSLRGYVEYSQGKEGLTTTKIGGYDAIVMEKNNPDGPGTYKAFFIKKDKYIYALLATLTNNSTVENTEFNNIQSTFQFTP